MKNEEARALEESKTPMFKVNKGTRTMAPKFASLLAWLPPVHPLWIWKIGKINNDPSEFIKLSRKYLVDMNESLTITKILDVIDYLFENSNSNFDLTFMQFFALSPFLLHHYSIINKYYQSQTNKYLFSNTMICKIDNCSHKVKILLDFSSKKIDLRFVNGHNHELSSLLHYQSGFLKSCFESFAKLGIKSGPILIKAVRQFIGSDLSTNDKTKLQFRLGLDFIKPFFATNIIERIKNEHMEVSKTIGEEFEGQYINKKPKLSEGQSVWKI